MKFEVYTNRWSHTDTYTINKNENGWDVRFKAHSGPCDKDGSPYLFGNFRQDSVSYPSSIGNFMEFLWEQMDKGAVSDDEAQEMLQELADWVSACEHNEPKWQGWNC